MKVLSIDIGAETVKAIELDVTYARTELADYLIKKVPSTEVLSATESDAPQENIEKRNTLSENQISAIKTILSDRLFKFEKLVINVPHFWTTNRVYQLPTKDRKTIQSSVRFELEDDLPFNLDDVVFDTCSLGFDGTNTSVYASVALKKDLQNLLSQLATVGINPDLVTTETWAFSQILKRSLPNEYTNQPVCVVSIGAEQTLIHIYIGDAPALTHVCDHGGLEITRAIAKEYNLDFESADQAKIENAFILTESLMQNSKEEITAEQKQFSQTIQNALFPIIREIRQCLMAFKSTSKSHPKVIYLSGPTTLIPNIAPFFQEQLKISTFLLNLGTSILGEGFQGSERIQAQLSVAIGLALCATKNEQDKRINFRKDIFAKSSGIAQIQWNSIKKPVIYFVATMGFIYFNLITQAFILNYREKTQTDTFEKSIKAVLGNVTDNSMENFKEIPKTLTNAVNKEIAKYKPTTIEPPKGQISAFDLLNQLSKTIPRDIVLDVSIFEVKEGRFKLVGLLNQPSQIGSLAKSLEDSKIFSEIKKEKSDEDPKTKKLRFEFSGKIPTPKGVKT